MVASDSDTLSGIMQSRRCLRRYSQELRSQELLEEPLNAGAKIIDGILNGQITRQNLQQAKIEVARGYRSNSLLTNAQIYGAAEDQIRYKLVDVLQRKPTRTASGLLASVAVRQPV